MRRLLLCIAAAVVFPCTALSQPYLSTLSARGGPLYTYYAAPPHRSNLNLDHAYKLVLNRLDRGLEFETERGEMLGLAFKVNDAVRYFTHELARSPLITHSYSDVVRFRVEPFHGVEITATFAVYASASAVLELEVTNDTGVPIELDIYPFFYAQSGIADTQLGQDLITFSRPQPQHPVSASFDLPHADTLYNFFRLDEPAQSFGAYAALGPFKDQPTGHSVAHRVTPPGHSVADHVTPQAPLSGEIVREDGSLCTSDALQLDIHYGDALITDAGSADILPGDGTYNVAERYLPEAGDVLLRAVCEGEQGEAVVASSSAGADIHLSDEAYVLAPQELEASTTSDYRTVFLLWESTGAASYDLYRAAPSTPWHFRRVADSLTTASYFDDNVEPDSAYRYTVVARYSSGQESGRSGVRQKSVPPPPPEPTPSFFDETELDQLSGDAQEGPLHVAAFQRTLQLDDGESRTLRIIREVSSDPTHEHNADLTSTSLDQIISESEAAFDDVRADVYRPPVYWSAMNLARQSVARLHDGVYLVDRRGASDPRRALLQEPSNLLAVPVIAAFDRDLASEILLTVADSESDGFIPYWTGRSVPDAATADPETAAAFPPILARTAVRASLDGLDRLYDAASAVHAFWAASDADGDGLAEWRHPLESMRPTSVIWREYASAEVEALDLNVLLVQEARALAELAADSLSQAQWRSEADARAARIRDTFWDEETGFFYHADQSSNDITPALKRKEIIGFMPGGGIASRDQGSALAQHYADPDAFNRPYGLPSLSASDPAYHPSGTWDGPVHAAWQWSVAPPSEHWQVDEGLMDALEASLTRSHDFYELYSPDHEWAGHAAGGVENSLAARRLWVPIVGVEQPPSAGPTSTSLYPNPFRDEATLQYTLDSASHVRITIHDLLGRELAVLVDEHQPAGRHERAWRPQNLGSGVYFYRIERGGEVATESATYMGAR